MEHPFNRILKTSFWILFLVLVSSGWVEGGPVKSGGEKEKKTVVLDPGHGGKDFGGKGPDGTLEKNATLMLSKLITTELETRYRVLLTRTDDMEVDLSHRTGRANHEKAKVFISIHTGGSYYNDAFGVEIFSFQSASETDMGPGDKKLKLWDKIQVRHTDDSTRLADILMGAIAGIGVGARVHRAPIAVLEGADMPAVLIEIGCLTNALDEKRIRDPSEMLGYAKVVASAISEFLK
ncbi:MAG: N-acetylmuramoyl-L-alanine amidase [Thermodesulfobacteriota bacterium]